MSKSFYDEALEELRCVTVALKHLEIIHSYDISKIEKSLKLGNLYKILCGKWQDILREIQEDVFIDKELSDELIKLVLEIKELENELDSDKKGE